MKVKLPKNVCEAINDFRSAYTGFEWMILSNVYRLDDKNLNTDTGKCLAKFAKESETNFKNLLNALVNGYEPIEEDIQVTITPRQQRDIKLDFDSYRPNPLDDPNKFQYCIGAQQGISLALTTFKIKIEGVNQ